MWISRKKKVYSFHADPHLKILKLISWHIFPPLFPPDTSADTQSHPGVTTPEMTEEWTFTSVFGNYHDYHDSLGNLMAPVPFIWGVDPLWQKKSEGTTLAAKPPNWLNWRESTYYLWEFLWIRQVRINRLQFQAPSPFSKFITQPVAFFGAKRPAARWFQRILMKFNQIMEHVGRDISIARAMNHESSALKCHLPNLGTGKMFVCFSMVLCFPSLNSTSSHHFHPKMLPPKWFCQGTFFTRLVLNQERFLTRLHESTLPSAVGGHRGDDKFWWTPPSPPFSSLLKNTWFLHDIKTTPTPNKKNMTQATPLNYPSV